MSAPQPPRRAVRLLERWLPEHERTELIGDLNEEFCARTAECGASRAQWWYWRQAIGLTLNRRRLSGPPSVQTAATVWPWTDAVGDCRVALRALKSSPAFAAVALLSMTVSLGLATAVFSIVNTVLLEPLPFSTGDRVVRLGAVTAAAQDGSTRIATVGGATPPPRLSDVMVGAWLARRQHVEALAAYQAFTQTVVLEGDALRVSVAEVGPEFFDVLPVRPVAGRTLQRADGQATAPAVALLSQRLIAQRWADPSVLIGHTAMVAERPYEVVGILPADFEWPDRTADIWIVDRTRWPPPGAVRQAGRNALVIGVIRTGSTVADAQAEGQQISDDLEATGSPAPFDRGKRTVIVRSLADELVAPLWPALLLLTVGTFGVVVAANVNLAGFLLSRNDGKRREIAVRQALGASRWRIVRPLLIEQCLLGVTGGAGALLLGWWIIEALPLIAPPNLPRLTSVSLDGTAFLFACASSVITALLVGLIPAWRLPSGHLRVAVADGGAAMAGTGRQSERTRTLLVVSQVTVATLLLSGSALVGRSLLAMLEINTGYRAEGVLSFQVGTPQGLSFREPGRLTQFYSELESHLLAQPEVAAVGMSSALPMHGDTLRMSLFLEGLTPPRPTDAPRLMTHMEQISTGYLQTIGATLTRGRFFAPQDSREAEPVAIVNEAFVRTFMPNADPLVQVIPSGVRRFKVVGVIAPIKRAAATMDDDPALYLHTPQYGESGYNATGGMGTIVRTTGDPMALVPAIRRIVAELFPGAPVYNVMPLDQRLALTFAQPRFFAMALTLFACLALTTALLGVYGVLAAGVERRRVELGVRRALGATTQDIGRLIIGRAIKLAAVGLTIGIALAGMAAAVGRSLLYGISPADTLSYIAAVGTVLTVVLLGAWMPMRSALRIDPARVLRADP